MSRIVAIVTAIVAVFCISAVNGADWPQFRGPNRDGKSAETGLLAKWPDKGPELLWSWKGLGKGFSSISVAEGMVYVTGLHKKKGFVFAFDLEGNLVWRSPYGREWTGLFSGARTTPTFDSGRLYVISGLGAVSCFDAKTGQRLWHADVFKKYGGRLGDFGIAESPLIVDDKVICTPGGKEATIVALDKENGQTVWTCKIEEQKAACCSPVVVCRGSRNIVVTLLEDYVVGVDAESGELLWKDAFGDYLRRGNGINFVSPLYRDGMLYTTSGNNEGGAMYELSEDGAGVTRKWIDETLDCHHGGVVQIGNYIYGANMKNCFTGKWVCLEWDTGEVMYEKKWHCKGSAVFAEGMLYCYEEQSGNLALVRPTPEGFDIVSSFKVKKGNGRHIAHPAIAEGRLFIRRGATLMAYDIKG